MKIFSSIHEFRLLTFLLSLALLLGVCTLTITEADAKGNKKKEISAAINFRVDIENVVDTSLNKRGFGRILFTSASNDSNISIDGRGNAFFDVITEMMGTEDRNIITAKVIVDAQHGVYAGAALGRMTDVVIVDRGVDGLAPGAWFEGTARFIFTFTEGTLEHTDDWLR